MTRILVVFCIFNVIEAEIFTSMTHMEPLVRIETTLSTKIEDYIQMEMVKINKLRL